MAPDPKNGLVVTGYSVEGTMARVSSLSTDRRRFFLVYYLDSCNTIHSPPPSLVFISRPPCDLELVFCKTQPYLFFTDFYIQDIMSGPDEIPSLKGNMIPRRLSVDDISFSAHVDFLQNSEFIEAVKAKHIVNPPFRSAGYCLKP